ncbi:MAG: RrF2 family transcriptional regulator [Sandaracinaceae bacterium]
MKLSNKGRYGVKAMFDIAFHNHGKPTQIKAIAERQLIPPRFLEQIFQDLKRAGLVSSKRGPKGGYQLAKPAKEIRVGDIVRALEGPVRLGPSAEGQRRAADDTSRAVIDELFRDLAARSEACFDEHTLVELCARGEALGFPRRPPRSYVYVI